MSARPLLVLALAAALSGCVRQERFRYVQKQDACFAPQQDPVPGKNGENRPFASIDCLDASYKTAFVEFDQQGDHIDPDQATKALRLIEMEKRRVPGGKVITLVYVHGWKNNAGQARPGKMKDVERFSSALAELGFRAKQAGEEAGTEPVPVVGVYVGWKGRSLNGPGVFTWLSYWGRRNTGNRVGGAALASLLNGIIDTTVPDAADRSRVMLVGHSFGARVLEQAIEKGVRLYDPEVRAAVPVRPRVDLVLYVNAANDARLSLGRVQALKEQPIEVRHPDYDPTMCPASDVHDPICKTYPLIVAITSRGDLATKYLQPTANRINLDRDGAPMPPLPTGSFLDAIPSEGRVKRSAPAHLRFMQSHDVAEVACPAEPTDPMRCDAADTACAFAFRGRGDCTACFRTSRRLPSNPKQVFNDTAFWIMDMDKRVIRDHGDIWNLSTLSMLGELMAPRGFFEPGSGRMQIRAVPHSAPR